MHIQQQKSVQIYDKLIRNVSKSVQIWVSRQKKEQQHISMAHQHGMFILATIFML